MTDHLGRDEGPNPSGGSLSPRGIVDITLPLILGESWCESNLMASAAFPFGFRGPQNVFMEL
jgi:hypothetical protein